MEPSSIVIKEKKDTENTGIKTKSIGVNAWNTDYLKNCLQDSKRIKTTNETKNSTSSSESQNEILSAINECPFKGHTCPYASSVLPLKRRYNHYNGLCGIHQITGPCVGSKRKYDYDLCSICSEEMGQDVDIQIKLPVNLILHHVCNEKNDPDVVNTSINQDNELCDNKFIGIVEPKDMFFEARPHKDQETDVLGKGTLITSNGVSDTETTPQVSEVTNLLHSTSTMSLNKESAILKGLRKLGFWKFRKEQRSLEN